MFSIFEKIAEKGYWNNLVLRILVLNLKISAVVDIKESLRAFGTVMMSINYHESRYKAREKQDRYLES